MKPILIVLLLSIGTTAVGGEASPEPTPEIVRAVWQEHELILRYQDFTTMFSCNGLKSKVSDLLRELGARRGFRVRSYGCSAPPAEVSPIAGVRLRFAALRPAPPDFDGETVAAAWADVDLSVTGTTFLERGDCVLVEHFRDKVLPAFTHEIVSDRTACVPHQLSGTAPRLRLRVLRAVP